jgi:hypothetical protein
VPCRLAGEPGPGRHATLEIDLAEPVDGAAPGQLACLLDGEVVVGWGTIARGSEARRYRTLKSALRTSISA